MDGDWTGTGRELDGNCTPRMHCLMAGLMAYRVVLPHDFPESIPQYHYTSVWGKCWHILIFHLDGTTCGSVVQCISVVSHPLGGKLPQQKVPSSARYPCKHHIVALPRHNIALYPIRFAIQSDLWILSNIRLDSIIYKHTWQYISS